MSKRNVILIADDVDISRTLLSKIFREQYEVAEAENGQVAIEYLQTNADAVACLLLDVMMPVKNGFDVMEYMMEKKLTDSIPIILITGDDSKETERISYEYKVSDIIYKPFSFGIVMRRVKNIIDLYQHINDTNQLVQEQTKQISEHAKELTETNDIIIDALGSIIEYKDIESKEHVKRIKTFTDIMLRYAADLYPDLELTNEKVNKMVRAAALHDIGKIGIPDEILLHRNELTPSQHKILQTHTTIGCEILECVSGIRDKEFYQYCYDICRSHHERWDGSGFPDKLAGDDIPFAAQIVALVDTYDRLVVSHAYRSPYTHSAAVNAILSGEYGVFSPKSIECFKLAQEDLRKLVEFSDQISLV